MGKKEERAPGVYQVKINDGGIVSLDLALWMDRSWWGFADDRPHEDKDIVEINETVIFVPEYAKNR